MKLFDWILVCVLGLALPAVVVLGATSSRTSGLQDRMTNALLGAKTHQSMDPFAPEGLPEGVVVDRETGYLQGIDLPARHGEIFLPWDRLRASEYPNGIADVPADLQAMNGKQAALVGFVMPLFEPAQFREFVLVGSTLTCCFGAPPGLGGIVKVDLKSDAEPMDMVSQPVVVRGTFVVKEMRLSEADDAPVVLLYRIEQGTAEVLK